MNHALHERGAELRRAQEYQEAASEILRIISRSRGDVQPVLDAIVESATRLSNSRDAAVLLIEAGQLKVAAA